MSGNWIDKNTRGGKQTVRSFYTARITLFTVATMFGLQLVLLWFGGPLYPKHAGAWPWLWLPLGIIGGFFWIEYRQGRRAMKEERQAIKTPEQIALEETERQQRLAEMKQTFIGLYLGDSTGMLHARGHVGGVQQGYHVELSREDASKNIIIFGGTGGGKTSRSINPLLRQIFMQDAGALIFDIKTDFQKEVAALASMTGRTYKVVGDSGLTLNLFRGCSPELAASFLKSCFLVQGQGSGDSAFWVDSATEMARHCLTLLNLLRPGQYSIAGLYDLVFDEQGRDALLAEGAEKLGGMTDRQQRFFIQSQRYFVNVWAEHDDKLRKNILGTMNAVLSPFAHPDMVDAFSAGSDLGEADMTELINDGAVFLVNIPMTKYGREGSRFAYLLVKLRFMNMMRERRTKPEWNQERPVAFVSDEYQSIIDPLEADFWDKSRSTRTIGIVSMQGVASLIHALGNNRQTAEAILQNFRQKIVFRTEDEATLRYLRDVLGQVDVRLVSGGESYSESRSRTHSMNPSSSESQSWSESENASIQRQDLFSANDMRKLSADFCLFVGNIGDHAADEVLHVKPLYVN